jgi:hypothetical protein
VAPSKQIPIAWPQNVNMKGLLIAAGQNLKRLLQATGWGKRQMPEELRRSSPRFEHSIRSAARYHAARWADESLHVLT